MSSGQKKVLLWYRIKKKQKKQQFKKPFYWESLCESQTLLKKKALIKNSIKHTELIQSNYEHNQDGWYPLF